MIFFSKNCNLNFLKTSTTPRGMNGIDGTGDHNEGEKQTCWEYYPLLNANQCPPMLTTTRLKVQRK